MTKIWCSDFVNDEQDAPSTKGPALCFANPSGSPEGLYSVDLYLVE